MSLDLERERAVQALCAHYARDHLTTGELEARFERVYQAPDRQALATVLEGLPALPRESVPALPYDVEPRTTVDLAPRETERRYFAFFSEVKKSGPWRAPETARVRAILGTVVLDLREADLPLHGLHLDAEAVLGEIKVILPVGVGADVDCDAMLAEVSDKSHPGRPDAPVVRVRGSATLGQITVVTKLPKKERLEGWRAQLKGLLGG